MDTTKSDLNPAMVTLDEYSVTSIPLTLLCKGKPIGTATGFFYKSGAHHHLVSNWHVFSGRNTYTGQANRKDAAVPDALALVLHGNRLGTYREGLSVPLEDGTGASLWRQHARGQDVDVAILPVGKISAEYTIYELPRMREAADMALKVAMDAFIIGFPKVITHQRVFPIWKRASVATEPNFSHDDRPVFLVDAASREGMSGAPVVLRSFGGYDTAQGGRIAGPGAFTRFVGIYSGRYGAEDELGAQLGRVWHRAVIDEVIEAGLPGAYELRARSAQ